MNRTTYFERYAHPVRFLESQERIKPGVIIVIPCYKEENLKKTWDSLAHCMPPTISVEVYWVVNSREQDSEEVKQRCRENSLQLNQWIEASTEVTPLSHKVIEAYDLPKKKAGVGLARKIGLDEAAWRSDREDTWLVCLDADCEVSENYLMKWQELYLEGKYNGCSIHFEHPLENEAIIQYELFLRYFIEAQKWLKLPYAFHTVGSSMGCTVGTYFEIGGMNRRKAGEDFYFLQKVISRGKFFEMNDAHVIPSARNSDRVPFGTGRAMVDYNASGKLRTYPFQMFKGLGPFVTNIEKLYQGKSIDLEDAFLLQYLRKEGFSEVIRDLRMRSTRFEVFRRHFFSWFDGFRLMRYGNDFVQEQGKPVDNFSEALLCYREITKDQSVIESAEQLLMHYRQLQTGEMVRG